MRASFSVSASVTPPNEYVGTASANHQGQLLLADVDTFDDAAVDQAVGALRDEFETVIDKIELGLKAHVAEKRAADLKSRAEAQ